MPVRYASAGRCASGFGGGASGFGWCASEFGWCASEFGWCASEFGWCASEFGWCASELVGASRNGNVRYGACGSGTICWWCWCSCVKILTKMNTKRKRGVVEKDGGVRRGQKASGREQYLQGLTLFRLSRQV
jgi:hypothetical protein